MRGRYTYIWSRVGNKYYLKPPQPESLIFQALRFPDDPAPLCQVLIMVCIGPTPTADLFLFIPGPIGQGSWAWVEHPRFPGVLASDYAYNAHEASALVRGYACSISRQMRPQEAPRFVVLARGRVTGLVMARDEWAWVRTSGQYEPTGEPWITWRAVARRYWEVTGKLIERERFRARLDT